MPMGLLKWCLDYAKNPKTPPGGIFSAVKAAFVDAAKTDLLDTVDRIYSFRNEYIAHQEKELVDREVTRQAMRDWISGLRRIWREE
jgi:type III restriction enzyme